MNETPPPPPPPPSISHFVVIKLHVSSNKCNECCNKWPDPFCDGMGVYTRRRLSTIEKARERERGREREKITDKCSLLLHCYQTFIHMK